MNIPGVILPQGLCTCSVLFLELFPPDIHMVHILISVKSFRFHLLSEACPSLLSLFFILTLSSGMLNNLLRMSVVSLPRFFSLLIDVSTALLCAWHTSWD